MDELRALQADFAVIGDVRGLGLMIGVEFTAAGGSPAGDVAKAVAKACLRRRLMLLTCGPWGNTIRWIPPLIVTPEQVLEALAAFKESLEEVVS
jgi:4-aminobutyrate aminotransferase